jgi:hypothetical protein
MRPPVVLSGAHPAGIVMARDESAKTAVLAADVRAARLNKIADGGRVCSG